MFEKLNLKGKGCTNRVANQILLVFYMPNKPEKANNTPSVTQRRIDEAGMIDGV